MSTPQHEHSSTEQGFTDFLKEVTEIRSPEDRLRVFDQHLIEFQTLAFEGGGLSWDDCCSTVAVVRQNIATSTADSLEAFLEDCRKRILKQVAVNKQFTAMYSNSKNIRLMERGVKSGLGSLAGTEHFDMESLCSEGWIYVLKRLSAGSYEFRSPAEQGGFIKACGRNTGWAAKDRYMTRLIRAQKSHHEFEFGLPNSWATTAEDRYEVQPDPNKPNPNDDTE